MDPQRVTCPHCDSLVVSDNINISTMMAKCVHCHHVFALPRADAVIDDREGSRRVVVEESPPSLPARIVHDYGPEGELYLRRSWYQHTLIFLLFFCIFWDGFLLVWYSIALFGAKREGMSFWMMVLFPIFHLAVGFGLTYYVIAGFFNKTQILVDRYDLHLRHGPLPWWGNRSLPVSEIREIELEQTYTQKGQPMQTLYVNKTDGEQLKLASSIPLRHSRYLGYTLANHLNVPFVSNAPENPFADGIDAVALLKEVFAKNKQTDE